MLAFQKKGGECSIMKRVILAVIALGILSAPALAQKKDEEPLETLDREKKQQAEQLDQQYKRMLDRTRKDDTASARSDPWANMRAPKEGKR
jgi:Ni/Co efflux regulator RcnB